MSDSASCVCVTTTLHAVAGQESALEAALGALADAVRRHEDGCLAYQPLRSRHEPTRFLVFERYRDEAALSAHANSEHFRDALLALMACLSEPPVLVVYDALYAAEGSGR